MLYYHTWIQSCQLVFFQLAQVLYFFVELNDCRSHWSKLMHLVAIFTQNLKCISYIIQNLCYLKENRLMKILNQSFCNNISIMCNYKLFFVGWSFLTGNTMSLTRLEKYFQKAPKLWIFGGTQTWELRLYH